MQDASRYEIVDILARGDFATVYRARDRELGRGVAIKQIHQQYLADGRQLARYWQEAQLLASLQHPNILTIYDIVRAQGWLILELMRGSLQPPAQAEGIDLDYLRLVLAGCLSGLEFLHSHGVIHGDIKPSNLLVDGQGRVKLGDFGLARRVSNDEGSLLKGTTKYMAPELLSAQFGPIGPASDLYSLGFSAYELLCGAQFETLFPGLDSFGRDRQIAWMMWHAAADRQMPPIHRVLEGVPDDLAQVVERLVIKDQSRRYPSAKDVLRDLRPAPLAAIARGAEAAAEAARAEAARQKRRKRRVALRGPAPFARALCGDALAGETEARAAAGVAAHPGHGPARLSGRAPYRPESGRAGRRQAHRAGGGDPAHAPLRQGTRQRQSGTARPGCAQRFCPHRNHPRCLGPPHDRGLRLPSGNKPGPRSSGPGRRGATHSDGGRPARREPTHGIDGRRPSASENHLQRRRSAERAAGNAGGSARRGCGGRSSPGRGDRPRGHRTERRTRGYDRGDRPGHRRRRRYEASKTRAGGGRRQTGNGRRAAFCRLLRDRHQRPCFDHGATVAAGRSAAGRPGCRIPPRPHRPPRSARTLRDGGIIDKVQAAALDVIRQGEPRPTGYAIGTNCTITINGEPAELGDLHNGDTVEITHHSLDRRNPQAAAVAARRAIDRSRWAIVVGIQDYQDRSLGRLEYPLADAKLLRDTLVGRYQAAEDQVSLLTDESLVRLEQSIPERLGRIGPEGKLLMFFAGHACKDENGKAYLVPKDFDRKRIAATGLPLQWLVDELEKCLAKEKLLLLDGSHAGEGQDGALEPSTAEMLRTLRTPLRTVTAIASCQAGQRGADWPEKHHGLFAWLLARGYAGAADKNRDNRVEPAELFGYLQAEMAAVAERLRASQTPELFLPDDRPPRFSEEAKTAIRKLAARLRQDRVSASEAAADYAVAVAVAGQQIEPKLVYGLLLLKDKQRDPAIKQFGEIKSRRPDLLLPLQGIAWACFEKRAYQAGLEEVTELVSKIPQPKHPADPYPGPQQQVFFWAGQLREYAVLTVEPSRQPSAGSLAALDAAAARHPVEAQRLYEEGRGKSRAIHAEFQRRITAAESEAQAAKLKVERRGMLHYVEFPYRQSVQQILAGLEP